MSDPTPALNAALAKVQAHLPKLERDRDVTVPTKSGEPYSYSYATLANLSEVVLPLLAEQGLAFTAFPGSGSDGKFRLIYSLLHESGEERSGEFPLSGDGGIQQLGGRITYARRYCLAAVTGIAADEDDESHLADTGPGTAQRAQRQGSAKEPAAATARRSTPPPLPGEQAQSPEGLIRAQLTRIQTVFTSIGWTDRDDRLRAASTIVGRPLGSANELTKQEAHVLIEALDGVAKEADPQTALGDLLRTIRQNEEKS
jgi:hypothetical protein